MSDDPRQRTSAEVRAILGQEIPARHTQGVCGDFLRDGRAITHTCIRHAGHAEAEDHLCACGVAWRAP